MQINAERTGNESPLTTVGTSLVSFIEMAASSVAGVLSGGASAVVQLPQLERDNATLRDQNKTLEAENERLHELAAEYASVASVTPIVNMYPRAIQARVIGFPPENTSRAVTIDKGSISHVQKDDGVVASGGIVGRVVAVDPFSSKVLLITDYTSRLPAVTRRGRFWGIARGNLSSVRMEYLPQDAPVKIGDVVVTGQGHTFRAGVPIGRVVQIERGDTTLYQTAVLKPAVNLGSLDRVVVVPR
ncbi:MAG TPA: rod shape-determining protein MreC [Candidatus Baltobacteraceae bacterium]|nr:rod shape-determining protein MreC [Candidatus Baltobacteraceae bacterium]